MLTLGLSGTLKGSSACLVEDGRVVAAVEEEQFQGQPNSLKEPFFSMGGWPHKSIAWILSKRQVSLSDVDHIAYAWDPEQLAQVQGPHERPGLGTEAADEAALWGSFVENQIKAAPRIFQAAQAEAPASRARRSPATAWHYVPHQTAHAASAYLASPFDEAAVLCVNARGERAGTTYGQGKGPELRILGEVAARHSLGLLYERVTWHLGFHRERGEAQVMTLAAYGKPTTRTLFQEILQMGEQGQYEILDTDLTTLLGPARRPDEPIETRHKNMACSLQEALSETVLQLAAWLKHETRSAFLTVAGGVFRNCVLNTALRDSGLFDNVWVQPAAGASCTAMGAALWIDQAVATPRSRFRLTHACLGPEFSVDELEAALVQSRQSFGKPPAIAVAVAARLASGKTVGWFQGGLEFGAQALGSRSILATPTDPAMVRCLNTLKDRYSFEPIASAVLVEAAVDWFEDGKPSPFRSFITRARGDKGPRIPSAIHIDGTARVQTVDRAVQPLFHDVIEAFGALTGVPVLLNTGFATRGRPLVCTPADAIEAYASSSLDALALGPFLLEKGR